MPHVSNVRLRALALIAMVVTASLAALLLPGAASAASRADCLDRKNGTYQQLLACITIDGVRAHQAAFQEIAENNDDPIYPGTRAAGTEGYDESAEYVADLMEDAGYEVTIDEFDFTFQFPVILRQITPTQGSYFANPAVGTGFGNVTANVVAVDINLVPPRANTSGCEAADFAAFPTGSIALMQRGTCPFATKAFNAQAAGASAVVLFNQGDTAANDRNNALNPTLNPPPAALIPVVGTSFADGALLAQPGSTAQVSVTPAETRESVNVIAELEGDNDDNVVMAGAHLDSETLGPGINDNGSGSAALIETALMMQNLTPTNTIRFAWWGAEESGLVGSTAYVAQLSAAERADIALYMNYDMIGSPNYFLGVYDADRSTFAATGVTIPNGSTAIEDVYEAYYTKVGEPYDDSEFSGRSDYQAFINANIPSGGLFTGAEVEKTAAQQAIWGGTAGQQFDPCYHIACDTYDNVNLDALEVNSDLVAFAQLTFAYSTQSVNGEPGTTVPGSAGFKVPTTPAGPEGTFPDQTP